MNHAGDAAEQVVRMSLEGAEVALKITGVAAKNLAAALYTILKDQKKTKGKARIEAMLREKRPLKAVSYTHLATKKDFETQNRKKFCSRIATGDYDAVIIGHSQFEKIPMSAERQQAILQQQIDEILFGIEQAKAQKAERYTCLLYTSADEQPSERSGGDHTERADLQLISEPEQPLSLIHIWTAPLCILM